MASNSKDRDRPRARRRNKQDDRMEALRHYIRTEGIKFLDDPNISSIGIGYKVTDNVRTGEISVQFTVVSKRAERDASGLEALETELIPDTILVAGQEIATDVIQRDFTTGHVKVQAEETDDRKLRVDVMRPGISVSHPSGSAGTLGMIVFDRQTGDPCMLSNWHVLHRAQGEIGDTIVQPGPHDDNDVDQNGCGRLVRSHLGQAGDCAIARIEDRAFERPILGLDVEPSEIVRVDLDDLVIKSGRTTSVTRGVVRRVDVIATINYDGVGDQHIGAFEIGPEDGVSPNFEVSMGGDSGSTWMVAADDGTAADLLAGLHFAGETPGNPDEHALACYAHSVFKKLNISLDPIPAGDLEQASLGYDPGFLSEVVPVPGLSSAHSDDAVELDGSPLIPYTHYSLVLSSARGFARFVAWNIDGGRIKKVPRGGLDFKKDRRIDLSVQHGNELYVNNALDKGHLARRADLNWGSLEEATRANAESFFFTNCAPQHFAFNRSSEGGIWGELENDIFAETDVEDLRISVLAGPIFEVDDPTHRDVQIPRDFWKAIAYRDNADGKFKVRAFIVTQRDLVTGLEALELDAFQIFQVSLMKLEEETGLDFAAINAFDTFETCAGPEDVLDANAVQARLFMPSVTTS